MNQEPITLYIFKYHAIDENRQEVSDFFIAESLDDAKIFLDTLGYTDLEVAPLKPEEEVPNFNERLDTSNLGIEFANLSNSIKNENSLFDSLIYVGKTCHNANRNIYFRLAYFVYKGDSLSIAMKKLGPVIPEDIIEQISIGEVAQNIPSRIAVIIRKYGKLKKEGFFTKIFKRKKGKEDSSLLDREAADQLKGIKRRGFGRRDVHLYPFKYKAVMENGKKIKGFFDAESIDDCNHFLQMQGYTNILVEPRKNYDIEIVLNNKIKTADLAFDLTQLSTYIKAGIPLVEGVTILAKQAKRGANKNAYERLVYDLLKGDSLSVAMEKQGKAFPSLLINMVKSAEMTGDLPTILDDMAGYYENIEQTRKAMKSAMTYPVFVLLLAIAVLAFMLLELVPQFIILYQSNGASLPGITLAVIAASEFMKGYWLYLLVMLVMMIVIFYLCYKKVPGFRKTVQVFAMKLPGFGKIIIYNEVYNFTKTFSSLINHGVFITDSMEILSKITNNEVYKRIIAATLSNLAKGESISQSFKGEWAFPTVAYHMLVTGENTGQLGLMMEKVSEHYQQLHKSMVDQLKSLVEPIMILLVAGIVGIILLSIITPMFDIYNQIQ